MIYPVKSKLFVVVVTVGSVLCGLVVSGCSYNASESKRLGFNRSQEGHPLPGRGLRSSQDAFTSNFKPAAAADMRIAKNLIRKHLHAFGRNDFHLAFSLLTPEYRKGIGDEARLRSMVSGRYSDFMHVKRVRWQDFSKNAESGEIVAFLSFEANNGNLLRATYVLQPQDGHYLIGLIESPPPFRFNDEPGSPGNRQNPVEERMFSGVLFSPTPRYRVLDSFGASL